jgi:hypothetical protein
MLENLLRDEGTVPVVAELMAAFHQLFPMMTEILMRGRGQRGKARDRTRAALGHAISFRTWQGLTREQGLSDEAAAELMRRLVAAAA